MGHWDIGAVLFFSFAVSLYPGVSKHINILLPYSTKLMMNGGSNFLLQMLCMNVFMFC